MISVCMPYRDRQHAFDRSLKAYDELYTDIEVSVCDDGSPQLLKRNVEVEIPVLVTRLPQRDYPLNPCVPINKAVNQSTGDLICLTNPEVIHTEDILTRMENTIDLETDYIIAAVRSEHTGRWLAKSDYKGDNWASIPEGSGFHFCVLFTRTLWEKAGGFDERYREGQAYDDSDWVWRVHDAGGKFIYRDDCLALDMKVAKCPWPRGGAARNKKLFNETWSHKWS